MPTIDSNGLRLVLDLNAPPTDLNIDVQAYVKHEFSRGSTGFVSIRFSGVLETAAEFTISCSGLSQAYAAGEILASYLLLAIRDKSEIKPIGSVELWYHKATIKYTLSVEGITIEDGLEVVIAPVDDAREAFRVAHETINRICTESFNARDGLNQNALRAFSEHEQKPPFLIKAIARLNG
jgi:hypothetical protein